MEPDVLIVHQMNGEDLTPDHGYPLRAIVPGNYGMSSVKWLTDVVAVAQPFRGYWQTADYAYWDDSEGIPVRRHLGRSSLFREQQGIDLARNEQNSRPSYWVQAREMPRRSNAFC
jgi:DMSO/TMAO reductase YedYZ molybdopterin-dependent catalytic subunit